MGPSTNWLSFSLSPMEMLRSSESQFMSYENSSTDSPHYLIDNFYTNGKNPNFFCNLKSCLVDEKLQEKDIHVDTFVESIYKKICFLLWVSQSFYFYLFSQWSRGTIFSVQYFVWWAHCISNLQITDSNLTWAT